MALDNDQEDYLLESIQTILDWAPEGDQAGMHNFLRIKVNEDIPSLVAYLSHNGYTVLVFNGLNEENRNLFEKLHIYAQSYMEMNITEQNLPQGKIAMILTDQAWTDVTANQDIHDLWRANGRYGTSLGF